MMTEFNPDPAGAREPFDISTQFSGKILVVEDDSASQKTILAILTKLGLETDIANNGKQAGQKATKQLFDLILMDMHMPKMNGYEATKSLRKQGLTIPIIALTASVMKNDLDKCLTAGCDLFLSKPVNRNKLLETLAKYLPSSELKNKKKKTKSKSGNSKSEVVNSVKKQIDHLNELISGQQSPKEIPVDKHRDQIDKDIIDWPELETRIESESLIKEIISSFFVDNTTRL